LESARTKEGANGEGRENDSRRRQREDRERERRVEYYILFSVVCLVKERDNNGIRLRGQMGFVLRGVT